MGQNSPAAFLILYEKPILPGKNWHGQGKPYLLVRDLIKRIKAPADSASDTGLGPIIAQLLAKMVFPGRGSHHSCGQFVLGPGSLPGRESTQGFTSEGRRFGFRDRPSKSIRT